LVFLIISSVIPIKVSDRTESLATDCIFLTTKKLMKIQEKELKIVEEFKHLVSQKIKIHDVVVLGSRARGDAA